MSTDDEWLHEWLVDEIPKMLRSSKGGMTASRIADEVNESSKPMRRKVDPDGALFELPAIQAVLDAMVGEGGVQRVPMLSGVGDLVKDEVYYRLPGK